MGDMLSQAGAVTGKNKTKVEEGIKLRQLIGCDIDPWVSIIAKMNMYIHGDGKSNIRRANGLTLSKVAAFGPSIKKPLIDMLDVVLTNPPLGDIDFAAVADQIARDEASANGEVLSATELAARAGEWSSGVFEVVPHRIREEREQAVAAKKTDDYIEKAVEYKLSGDFKAEARARKKADEWAKKRRSAESTVASGRGTHEAAGTTAKGGVLFISALIKSLKSLRDASLPLEWRGGILGMVVDEAVLNTPIYADARAFVRRNYFVKAIVSLPRDAFADLAKTTAKTSIILLIKKEDASVLQREPVFFARAFKTGASSKDLTGANDLLAICDAFDRWRTSVLNLCGASGGALSKTDRPKAEVSMRAGEPPNLQTSLWDLDSINQTERLDEAYWCMKGIIAAMPVASSLASVADLISEGRSPPERDIYSFATVSRVDVRVKPKKEASTSYDASDLRMLKTGDVLISGIDLVHGSVGVVEVECNEMVVSKEYYILNVKEGVDPHYLVALLRTSAMRRIIEGTITGTSNRTRVESADILMSITIPPFPKAEEQRTIGDRLRGAHLHHKQMVIGIHEAEAGAAAISGLAVLTHQDDGTLDDSDGL